jgi:hypothetical protein
VRIRQTVEIVKLFKGSAILKAAKLPITSVIHIDGVQADVAVGLE